MNMKVVKVLSILGGSLIGFGLTGIGKALYQKGKTDAYKEITRDLSNIQIGLCIKESSKESE